MKLQNSGKSVMNSGRSEFRTQPVTQKVPLKVLVIAKEYPPHVTGGLGVHYYELVGALKNHAEIILISARDSYTAPGEEHYPGLHIYRIRIPKIFPFDHVFFNLFALVKSLKFRVDVTHICSPFGVLNALFKRTPTIVKFHTLYTRQQGTWLYNHIYFPIASLLDFLLIRRADLVVTTSLFMKEDVLSRFPELPESKVKVILNGLNDEFFVHSQEKRALRRKLHIDVGAKVVLFVGRFVKRKGALNLVRAITDVMKTHHDSLFLFVGTGFSEGSDYEKQLKREIENLEVAEHLRVIPWLERAELLNYYGVADVFVHPALYEPFGMVVAEALAAGLPVIASRAGGPEEIIKDAGILIEKNDPASLSTSIINLLNSSSRMTQFSQLAIARARNFSWNKTAQETLSICQGLLSETENEDLHHHYTKK